MNEREKELWNSCFHGVIDVLTDSKISDAIKGENFEFPKGYILHDSRGYRLSDSIKEEVKETLKGYNRINDEKLQSDIQILGTKALTKGKEIFEQRGKDYKRTDKTIGEILSILLSGNHTENYHKQMILTQIVVKLVRLCNSNMTHYDSALDLMNYAAMMADVIEEENVQQKKVEE